MIESSLFREIIRKRLNLPLYCGISMPVIRYEKDYCVACFITLINPYDISSGIPRPHYWVTTSLDDFTVLSFNRCDVEDFSTGSFDKRYNIDGVFKNVCDFELFDEIREQLINQATLNRRKYKLYLKHITNIPLSYRRFLRELSI